MTTTTGHPERASQMRELSDGDLDEALDMLTFWLSATSGARSGGRHNTLGAATHPPSRL